jgi:hypothetical protein
MVADQIDRTRGRRFANQASEHAELVVPQGPRARRVVFGVSRRLCDGGAELFDHLGDGGVGVGT